MYRTSQLRRAIKWYLNNVKIYMGEWCKHGNDKSAHKCDCIEFNFWVRNFNKKEAVAEIRFRMRHGINLTGFNTKHHSTWVY